ncbi:MAG TPA: hypothetical protein VF834_10185, partial [Streptosporangiaceae bacterium]
DDRGLAALENGDDGVGRPEVNAYRSCHVSVLVVVGRVLVMELKLESSRRKFASMTGSSQMS